MWDEIVSPADGGNLATTMDAEDAAAELAWHEPVAPQIESFALRESVDSMVHLL